MDDSKKQIEIPNSIIALILIQMLVKLLLLDWYTGEYTDGIIQLGLFENSNAFFPPLFPALAKLISLGNVYPVYAGRLVSIFASSLTVLPIYLLGRRLWSEECGFFGAVVYSVSPIHWRWSVRVMTDPLFTLFFAQFLLMFMHSIFKRKKTYVYKSLFWAGCGFLTRYQGAIFLPMIALAWWRARKDDCSKSDIVLALLPWLASVGWIVFRGVEHAGQFQERAAFGIGNTLLAYWTMTEEFMLYLPYALTYPIFIALLFGVVRGRRLSQGMLFAWASLYLLIPWVLVHAAFQSYQYRYFLPLLPVFSVWAGTGLRRIKNGLLQKSFVAVVVVWGLLFSGLVLYFQRDTFGDFRASAEYLQERLKSNERVFSDEVYRPGVENVKMRFWSGKDVKPLPTDLKGFRPGDLVVLHNTYTDLNMMHRELSRRYRIREVFKTRVETRPLLPDIMSMPPVTSQPACMSYRYMPQQFLSIVIVIEDHKSFINP